MAPLTDEELLLLLHDIESDRTERKESWKGEVPEKARQAVCAFANDLPNHRKPGVLFIGARDDGTSSNLAITEQLELTLADMKSDGRIVPPPLLTVQKRILGGAPMAVVTVWPAIAPPVRFEGRIWVRTGPRRSQATAQEERVLNERRRYRDIPFDIHPLPSASIFELNQLIFETEYLPQAFAPDVIEANDRTFAQRLAVCRMIVSESEPIPTLLGLLTIGTTPRSWVPCHYVQFLRIRGVNWGDDIIDQEEIDGTLSLILRRIDDKLKAHLTTSADFTGNDTESHRSPYPLVALQQLLRNAVMHRTYEGTNAPIRIYWFQDRIEIMSPGGPYGLVTIENFGQQGVTDYRNPHIAEAMKVLGYVQRFGLGIVTAQRALQENGNPPPEFDVKQNQILITLRKGL